MKALLEKIRNILRSRKNRQVLTRSVSVVAAVAVFITTYALVLPAITMEQNAPCGIEEHQHTDACYEERLVCGIPEGKEHHHDASCYEKFLICGKEVHIHSPECYQQGSRVLAFADGGEAVSIASGAAGQSDVLYGTDDSDYDSDAFVTDGSAAGEEGMEGTASGESVSGQPSAEESDVDKNAPEGSGAEESSTDGAAAGKDAGGQAAIEGSEENEAGEAVSGENVPGGSGSETASENVSADETITAPAGDTSGEMASEDAAAAASTAASTTSGQGTAAAAQELKGTEDASFKSGTFIVEGEGYKITLEYTEKAEIPENAELSVREITAETDSEAYEACLEQAGQQVAADEKTSVDRKASRFFDIEILERNTDSEGNEVTKKIEPSAPVSVNIQIIDDMAVENVTSSADQKPGLSEPAVLHFAEEGVEQLDAEVKEGQVQEQEGSEGGEDRNSGEESESAGTATEISFEAESFSIYAVVYTVDFNWEVDGKEYEFSIPGGGFVSLEHLVEMLGIASADENTENGAENVKNGTENGNEFVGQVPDVDVSGENEGSSGNEIVDGEASPSSNSTAYEEAIKLNEVEVSEAAQIFVADVESVEFSKPELVWVGKVNEAATVGGLKEVNRLNVEYSADLKEEQIEEINAQTVKAGDWALIGMQPFISEETLTVTMTNGDQFMVKVTDAQISTHVITADGTDFIITVTYGDDAKIPEGAKLEADEIVPGTKKYEDYLAHAQEAISKENRKDSEADNEEGSGKATEVSDNAEESADAKESSGGNAEGTSSDAVTYFTAEGVSEDYLISFARFFDIRIMADRKKIEPAAPVKVTITYADALDIAENDGLYAVHFGENGTEVINTSSGEDNKSVIFMQDSFSVTGTIVTSNEGWPTSGQSYVMYVQSGNNYYAVDHNGNLHQVSVSGNNLTFPDDAETFDLNNYLWTYEARNSGWPYYRDNRFVYYLDDQGSDHYLAPNTSSGISETTTNLLRENNGKIYYNPGYGASYYIGINGNKINGNRTSGDAVSIQFASFPKSVTIHFVDRDGEPLTGVTYTGSGNYPVTANADGTFTVPYIWDKGNSEYTLQLDTDFSKTGYTYASSHLAGTRQNKILTYDGLTIDAALKERGNQMYYYTDPGRHDNTMAYGALDEKRLNDSLSVTNETGTGTTYYTAANVNKDIYVILDPVPSNSAGQGNENLTVKDPEFNKSLEYNEDGTYTLSLNVKGHGINAATNPKANVIFVVDTSSSMDKTEGTGTDYSRLHDTKPELKTLAYELLLSNSMTGKDSDTVEVSMVSFDGGVVDEIGWTTDYGAFADKVDTGLALHRGTDWEDALKRAYEIGLAKQEEEPDQQVFVVFFTDGEASQYTSFHGKGTYNTEVNPDYSRWYSYFLSRESAKDEARAIVNAGMQFYSVYAFNIDRDKYNNKEAGSDLLHNLVKYAYNSEDLGNKNFFARASSTKELQEAFNSILLSIREFLGFSNVVMNDDITSLTSTGINLVGSAVGGFSYTRSGGRYGEGTAWAEAPAATHTDTADGDVTSVKWDLGSIILEEGVTYTVSFKVWPNQEAYDWLANLQNGTKTWDDVVAAGLNAPNGSNPQIVKNGDSYSLLTNKPSLDSEGKIINNAITYKKTHSETVAQVDIPAGTPMNTPVEGTDGDGNKTITTYTEDHGVYTKTVVTEKKTYFPNPDPMPLVPERMNVLKDWQTSMNTSHPADQLKFRVLVDGKYYQNDGSLKAGEEGQANAKELPVSKNNSWTNSINIAPGIVKYFDDDGNALSEALVLETGHKYTLEEFDLMEGGSPFLYYTSYEFHSQTMRPMIVDGTLKYLVLIDTANPAPENAETHTIGTETYYVAASGSGKGTLSGTNYRTAELDVTKIIQNSSGVELTDEELNAETFTYRVTLRIPDGTDPAGIVGYEYVPRTTSNAFTLFGYQTGETAFESDIARFSGKTFRSWYTLVYRDLVEWEDVEGRIISKTDENGNILWKAQKDTEGYHNITYDMTLNRNEVIRFTNLPTGTKYSIQEIYANYYQADNSADSAGHAPIQKAGNIEQEGYEITGVRTTNGTVSKTVVEKDTVSGTIETPNVRYYNQFTNTLKSVKVQVSILKTNQDGSRPLSGAVFDLYDQAGYEAEPQKALKTGLISSAETGKEGTIDLGKLADGSYYLVETSAPDGYNQLSEPVMIRVNQGNVTYSQENSTLDESGAGKTGDFHTGYQLKVVNDEGVELPSTGGPGTRLFTILGTILITGAGLLLLKRRRTIN